MHKFHRAAATTLVALATTTAVMAVTGPAEAVTRFANCTAMHNVYPHGVARASRGRLPGPAGVRQARGASPGLLGQLVQRPRQGRDRLRGLRRGMASAWSGEVRHLTRARLAYFRIAQRLAQLNCHGPACRG